MNLKKINSIVDFILMIAIIIGVLCVLVWFFPRPNTSGMHDDLFVSNLDTVKKAATSYFTGDRLPEEEGQIVSMTLGEMIDQKIVLPIYDGNNKACNKNLSHIEIFKTSNEYLIKTYLACSTNTDYTVESLGCFGNCNDNNKQANNNNQSKTPKKTVVNPKKKVIVIPTENNPTINPAVIEYQFKRTLYKGYKTITTQEKEYEQVKYASHLNGYTYSCPSNYSQNDSVCYRWLSTSVTRSDYYFPSTIYYNENGDAGTLSKIGSYTQNLVYTTYIPGDSKYVQELYTVMHTTIYEWDGTKWKFVIEGQAVPSTQEYNKDGYTGTLKANGPLINTRWGRTPCTPGHYIGDWYSAKNYSELWYVGTVSKPAQSVPTWQYYQTYAGNVNRSAILTPKYDSAVIDRIWTSTKTLSGWIATGQSHIIRINEDLEYTNWMNQLPAGYKIDDVKTEYQWSTSTNLNGWDFTGQTRYQ